ncbi:MAG: hypothetical protein F4Y92_02565 [Dehalococcoidia bacterium]|nr:hypothetical protein [Dehalococcoidia bacterium]
MTDEHGARVDDLLVGAVVYTPGAYESRRTVMGAVRFLLVEGVYQLYIHTDRYGTCTVSGIENAEQRVKAVLAAEPGASSRVEIVVSRRDSPGSPAWVSCRFDVPFHQIRGTVSGPSGEPLEGISVQAWGDPGGDTFGPWSDLSTNAEGHFEIEVPEGTFRLRLSLEFEGSGGCFLGYFGSDGRRAPLGQVARVVVDGGDVEGLAIALSGLPSKLCHKVEGVVVDTEGEPVAGSLVTFGDRELRNQRTDPTGTFRLHLREGRYLVQVETDLGDECTVEGYESATPGRPARIDVDGDEVDGLRIALSGGASASLRSIFCLFPPGVATTTLQPGWNLAGWTSEATDAGGLFEAIPALEAAYAWDAVTQAFKGAGRDDPAGTGDLTTIAPGMGLWLLLGGEEPVTWTRPATPEGGFVSLRPGWNLVAWAGRDGAAPEEAFAFLGEDLLAAAAWDAAAGKFRPHYPDAPPAVTTLQRLELGEALWLNVGAERRWLQPGATVATVEFVGEVEPETLATIGPSVDDVLAFFGERTGTFVPGITFSVGDHAVCADYGYGFRMIRLAEGCVMAVAHEYAHAVQFTVGGGMTARWLVEGVAERWSAQYYDHARSKSYEAQVRDVAIPGARFLSAPLEELESPAAFRAQGGGAYGLAHLAADWLASLAGGDDALIGFFGARTNEEDWQITFERVFSMGVDDFYTSFAAHRAEVALPHPRVKGVVLEADGAPLVGATVHARHVVHGYVRAVATGDDGAFGRVIESGAYDLWLTVDGCLLPWSSSGSPVKAVTARSGRLELDEGDVADLVITSSGTAADTCRWRWIRGTVTDLAGNPLGGVRISPQTWVDGIEVGTLSLPDRTTGNGLFAIRVPEGRYGLSVRAGSVGGHYEEQRGFTLHRPDAAQIVVGATDVNDVAIQFGVIRGVIRGLPADQHLRVGLQEGGRGFSKRATPAIEFIAPRGTFLLGVYCFNFRLVGWYGGDGELVTDRSQAVPIVLDDADVTVTLDIPASLSCQ